ncbi:general secretion pathway protein I [Chitinivorax tropicus]|uniref:Type II secretion system protein I n=1 Tax=Chitinivorax tropicus TaxID=714531 RepID=A0A840MHL3_9PROT|nr:type II secretion system minor pseudopilin GspI [Chitinivorax tropicus]MBB5017880.1 general secretion pathway protein I [Chitinivorax tropicus]
MPSISTKSPANGFTLIEVLIALVILAVALAAAMRATSGLISSVSEMKTRLAAGWVAQNRLNEHNALRDFPEVGSTHGKAEQAGIKFSWREDVSGTPNKDFRRIEIKVFMGEQTDYASAQLIGYLTRAGK